MKKIGWFTTARGPGSYNLFSTMMKAINMRDMDAKLSFVFINREIKGNQYRMRLVKEAEENGVPVILFPSDSFMPDLKQRDIEAWRETYGAGLRERISKCEMDFGVLAGYMLIFDRETCRKYTMINLHPALPGTYKGTWEEIIGAVVDNNDDRYGATVHLCTPDLDRGEPIAYDMFPLAGLKDKLRSRADLMKAIRAEELKREAYLLMEAIRMIVNGDLVLKDGKVLNRRGNKVSEYPNLAEAIDAKLGVH
jgi:phosphoribosylglycinamide formyltransferase 1